MAHGGKLLRSGPKKGTKYKPTLAKAAAREEARAIITRSLAPMLRSHVAHATGIGHLYTHDKNGKFTKITSAEVVDRLLAEGTQDKDYWIFTKDPSPESLRQLLDRALDRATEHLEMDVQVLDVAAILNQRHAKHV